MDSHLPGPTDPASPSHLRPHIIEALQEYVEDGRPLGDFLAAAVSNLLVDAYMHADGESARTMHALVGYLYNHMPSESWGSREVYERWMVWRRRDHELQDMANTDGEAVALGVERAAREALLTAWRQAKEARRGR